MRNRLEFAVAIQLLRTCTTVGKHSSEQKNHTWIIYNWAILYSSTLIGRGILYSLINIIIRTRATKIRSDVDRREKFSMACFNRRPETLVSHKSEMSKSRTACKLSAENKHKSYSAGRKPSWMTSRSSGTDGEPHFQIIENLWNRSQTGCPVIRQKWRRDTLWSKMRLKIHKRLCQSWSYVLSLSITLIDGCHYRAKKHGWVMIFFFPSFSNLPIFCEFPIGAYEALEIQMKINR